MARGGPARSHYFPISVRYVHPSDHTFVVIRAHVWYVSNIWPGDTHQVIVDTSSTNTSIIVLPLLNSEACRQNVFLIPELTRNRLAIPNRLFLSPAMNMLIYKTTRTNIINIIFFSLGVISPEQKHRQRAYSSSGRAYDYDLWGVQRNNCKPGTNDKKKSKTKPVCFDKLAKKKPSCVQNAKSGSRGKWFNCLFSQKALLADVMCQE